ncbi:MAG TPA: TIGR03862 family flavoprotein, partial [Rhizobium sp.]|nr:TIGR03862 family flavoprotein [Rhizobium sp.]
MEQTDVAIIGGGPAGLAAAERLSHDGYAVTVYDAMPTVARKFLLAGKSGLNITHSEPFERFAERFGSASPRLRAALDAFTPQEVRDWAAGLGTQTFVGSSGRVFPKVMKASPLLRAWLRRLDAQGVVIRTRHRWTGFAGSDLVFNTPDGEKRVASKVTLLALGGASWPRLGSDAAWVAPLRQNGVDIAPFRPANCGFDVA